MTPLRPLGPSERVLERVDRCCPQNFTTIVELRGDVDAERLAQGVPALLKRHPLLRARIARPGGILTFVDSGDTTVPVRLDERSWLEVVEAEITYVFATGQEPLLRIVWCPAEPEETITGRLLFTLHHTIGDGKSGVFATHDLLQAATGGELTPLAIRPDVDASMPPRARGLRGHLQRARFGWQQLKADRMYGRPSNPRYDVDVPPETRVPRVHPIAWEPERTRALLKRCRSEGTTVHGALLAAQVLAAVADLGSDAAVSVLCGSPVDLRPDLAPPVGEDLMLTVSMLAFRGRLSSHDAFWDVARRIRAHIASARDDHDHLVALGTLPFLGRVIGMDQSDANFARRWSERLPNTCGLTNLGRLDLPEQVGGIELVASHFIVNPSIFGVSVATATSTHGRLRWNHSYGAPTVSYEHGAALAADAERRVLEGIGVTSSTGS